MYHEDLDTWGPGDHAGTYRGHVPAMVSRLRAIEYIQSHDLLDHATEVGAWIRDRLRDAGEGDPGLGQVRGKGLFVGAEFVDANGDPDDDRVGDPAVLLRARRPRLDGGPVRQRRAAAAAARPDAAAGGGRDRDHRGRDRGDRRVVACGAVDSLSI